ncbi:MAG: hypothetical protein NUV51_05450 [Sulfuricaulis sp.]|nr:hypothetical protein [Sulfuricaulis sp.]
MNDQVEQTTLPEERTLREELAANLEAVNVPEPVAPVETDEQKTERLRDEAGRFAAKPDAELVSKPIPTPQATVAVDRPPRPSSWKKDYWADYDKIADENPKLAAYLNEREHQFASGVSTYKQEWEQAKPLIDAIAPFQPILQQHGIDPAQWVSNLGNAHHKLAMGSPQDKVAMFQRLATDYNVPVQLAVQDQQGQWQLLGQQQPQQFDPAIIPRLVQQELMAASTKQALETFTREAPEKAPHFETVKATMSGLLQAGLADDLQSAYEAALRHPRHADLFAELQQQQSAEQDAAARAAKQQKVQRARSNAVSTPTATPSGQGNGAEERGLRDEITANLRAVVGGRV